MQSTCSVAVRAATLDLDNKLDQKLLYAKGGAREEGARSTALCWRIEDVSDALSTIRDCASVMRDAGVADLAPANFAVGFPYGQVARTDGPLSVEIADAAQ